MHEPERIAVLELAERHPYPHQLPALNSVQPGVHLLLDSRASPGNENPNGLITAHSPKPLIPSWTVEKRWDLDPKPFSETRSGLRTGRNECRVIAHCMVPHILVDMDAISSTSPELMRCSVNAAKTSANSCSEWRTSRRAIAAPAALRSSLKNWDMATKSTAASWAAQHRRGVYGASGLVRRRARGWIRALAEDGPSSAEANAVTGKKREYFLPTTLEESIDQARAATRAAIQAGVKRLQLEVLLPLIGATDLDDWPGGIQQQFKAAGPVITSLLSGLVDDDGERRQYMIDEGDAVGCWESDKLALVLFPTPEVLAKVEALAKNEERPLLIVNTQWQSGQVISDFGFGSARRAREEFVNSFEVVYQLKTMRILAEDLRLLKRYPGDWQLFVLDAAGANECVAVTPERPSYKELQAILRNRKNSKASQGWFGRLFSELEFNKKR